MSHQSKFYRWRPAEASTKEEELKFPTKIQLNLGDKAITCALDDLDFYGNAKTDRGQHYEHDQIEYMFDLEQFVDSEI